eukprot:TRINITY_DN6194_c0_g1_i4.p1 TRINITY_DN6194_c0_g1~~TRINITY_DN6194_c0_g1_i4.p1  ORF type:complete len:386 (-),score=86.70 TRINITY_DN6194_c0_g1_i4:899-2056(-)
MCIRDRSMDTSTIIFAAAEGDLGDCQRGIACGLDPSFPDYDKRTSLHLAASNGQDAVARFLVLQGVDPHAKDRLGNSPIDDATRSGHQSTLEVLKTTTALDFSHLNSDHVDNAYRSMIVDNNGVIYQHLIDIFGECGILIDDPRVCKVITPRELLRSANSELPLQTWRNMCATAPIVLAAIQGKLKIWDFQCMSDEITAVFNKAAEAVSSLDDQGSLPVHDFLKEVDPKTCGVSVCSTDGQQFSIGDSDVQFAKHALGRPLLYTIACSMKGSKYFHEHVGIEPCGSGYNDLVVNHKGQPHNPLINTGAIVCASMVNPDVRRALLDVLVPCGVIVPFRRPWRSDSNTCTTKPLLQQVGPRTQWDLATRAFWWTRRSPTETKRLRSC